MPIYPRETKTKGRLFDVIVRHEGRAIWRRGWPTKKRAREEEARLRYELSAGVPVSPARLTLGEYLTRRWYPFKEASLDAKSRKLYKAVIHRAAPLHNARLARLSPMDLQAWVSGLVAEGLKPATVSVYHAVLKSALAQAVKWEAIHRNPGQAVSTPKRISRTPPILSIAQIQALFAAADQTALGPMVKLAVLTGMRWGELTARRWEEVDLERAEVRIKDAKTPRGNRTVALGPEALAALVSQKRLQAEWRLRLGPAWADSGLVFTTEFGRQVWESGFRGKWLRLVTEAGLQGLHFHDLRHAHATLLARAGVHPAIAQARLGHERAQITLDIYTRTSADDQRGAAVAVEQLIAKA